MTSAIVAILLCSVGITINGCSVLKPYQIDVQQGNSLDNHTVRAVKLGMTKAEVENLLGTPVLNNAFTDNCLTYTYTNQINGGNIEHKQLTLRLVDGKVAKIEKKSV